MRSSISLAAALVLGSMSGAQAQDTSMSFFVTSQNPGKGGDLGGLEGADAYCKSLATAAGASADKTWQAYLSTDTENAKDRIGAGPWYNAKGDKIADDVASLHGDANNITKQTALDETGAVINGRGDTPNRHDILTGSKPDGTAAPETCGNWTMGGAEGAAMIGPSRPHRPRRFCRRQSRGTRRMPRAAAAARRPSRAPAATACSTASPRTDRWRALPLHRRLALRQTPAPRRNPAITCRQM